MSIVVLCTLPQLLYLMNLQYLPQMLYLMNSQYLPQLLYLMDFMNYCIYLKFNLYLLQHLLTILNLFAFSKFLLLRHVIY